MRSLEQNALRVPIRANGFSRPQNSSFVFQLGSRFKLGDREGDRLREDRWKYHTPSDRLSKQRPSYCSTAV